MTPDLGWAILLADDHQLLRAGLKRLLLEFPEIGEVGEADTGETLVSKLGQRAWDLLILDVNLSQECGLALLERLRGDGCKVPTLVLSMYPESQFGPRAVRAGAAGYVMKSADPSTLLGAIRQVLHGGTFITPVVKEGLGAAFEPADWLAHAGLTVEELAVLRLFVAGRSEDEIAALLRMSVTQVSACRVRARQKLGLADDAALRWYAAEHGRMDTH